MEFSRPEYYPGSVSVNGPGRVAVWKDDGGDAADGDKDRAVASLLRPALNQALCVDFSHSSLVTALGGYCSYSCLLLLCTPP